MSNPPRSLLAVLILIFVPSSFPGCKLSGDAAASAPPPVAIIVQETLAGAIEQGEIAGAVTLVATREKVLHRGAVGSADLHANRPMRDDAVFWIASMSKPITASAVLMLRDERKLSVDDPVSKYLPELASLHGEDGEPVVVTIRHLLTHTSGMSEATREEQAAAKTLADLVPVYASRPVRFRPGTEWRYCQSGINTAARIVEVVSGLSFPEFLERRIFAPLGMKDTTFYLDEAQLARLAKSYRRTEDGKLEEAEISLLVGKSPTDHDRYPAANGGLFSTADDYARFLQMVLRGGEHDGRQLLSKESIDLMTSIQTGDLTTGFTPGNGWGLGWCVVREPQGVTEELSPGSYGHGGAYGTQAWVDPVRGRIYILMVQRANFPNADASDVRRNFQRSAAGLGAETAS